MFLKVSRQKISLLILEKNNIYVVNVPANCTDKLQPTDLSVNRSAKEFMRNKFSEWYVESKEATRYRSYHQCGLENVHQC